MASLELTQAQAHALLLQRTGYQGRGTALVKRLGLAGWYDSKVAARTSTRRRIDLSRIYFEECRLEAESIAPHLPTGVTLMDIGCGLAGPDLALSQLRPDLDFLLVDRDEFDDRPHYGFEAEASAYNSLDQTVAFLTANGLASERVNTVDVATCGFPKDVRVGAVMSLMSWGFHFPLATYLDEVHEVLPPGGVVIVDIRSGTAGKDELGAVFGRDRVREIASPHSAFPRLLATKGPS